MFGHFYPTGIWTIRKVSLIVMAGMSNEPDEE